MDVEAVRAFDDATAGLVADLNAVGLPINTLQQLVQQELPTAIAVPVLTRWLPLISDVGARRTIVSLLHSKLASPGAVQPLLLELERLNAEGDPDLNGFGGKWGIVSAICYLIGAKEYHLLVVIAEDARNGLPRQLAVESLAKMRSKRDELTTTMMRFVMSDDPTLFLAASSALALWRVSEAAPRVAQLLETVDTRPLPANARDADAYRAAERTQLSAALRTLTSPTT